MAMSGAAEEDSGASLIPLVEQEPHTKVDVDDDDDVLRWCLFCSGDETDGELIQTPCACTDTYVHTECLSHWITSKQKGRNREVSKFTCEVCRQPYEGVSSKRRFVCAADRLVLRSMLRICCGLGIAIGLMAWGIESVVQTDGEGVGANLFLPLALAMFCVGCLNCIEVLFTYYVRNTEEKLRFRGHDTQGSGTVTAEAETPPAPGPSTTLMAVGPAAVRGCRTCPASLGSYTNSYTSSYGSTRVRDEDAEFPLAEY